MNSKIYVTRPYLPPLEDFIPYLEQIWHNRILTNSGPFHQLLEKSLAEYLGVKYVSLFSNATKALEASVRILGLDGEVITTPYSFVATTHSLAWQGVTPIFIDVCPETLNIDPYIIESAITEKTTGILAVHTYGNPCNVEAIQSIGSKYNLKIIYDAAHAFGIKHKDQSILNFGDLSVLSFHATKVFNTFEGGL